MSLQPPPPERSRIGDVWVDPVSGHRFLFTGEDLDAVNYGWKPWDLENERYEYGRGDSRSSVSGEGTNG